MATVCLLPCDELFLEFFGRQRKSRHKFFLFELLTWLLQLMEMNHHLCFSAVFILNTMNY